jgi:hypothetical protein
MSSTNFPARQPAPDLDQWRSRDRTGDVSASDSFSVFAIKSLLHPTIPVLTLMACLFVWNEPLYGPYFLVRPDPPRARLSSRQRRTP